MKILIPVLLLICACTSRVPEAPLVMFGGEMHNSNASTPESIDASLNLAAALGFNCVLAPVSWELLEPEEGRFDFSLVDYMLKAAYRRGLNLGLLWFGTWKNGESSYPPLWVKENTSTFFRALDSEERPATAISPFCIAAKEADCKAFAALMAHLKSVDRKGVVRVVQVENECGVFMERDFSPAAVDAWNASAYSTSADPLAPQKFMAEAFAAYIDSVAAAGKKEYDIPMFANAWLKAADAPFGTYPNGGPRVAVLDVWKRTIKHLDFLSPDIYDPGFANFCAIYSQGQTLFIPETRCEPGRFYYAIGEAGCLGVFGFGYEEHYDNPYFVQECRVISELNPYFGLPSRGFFRENGVDEPGMEVSLELGGYTFDVHCIEGEKNSHGAIFQTGPDEFVVAGTGAWIDFRKDGASFCKLASCEELRGGKTIQVLNGDETAHGNMLYLRGCLFQEDYMSPDGTVVPAAMYGLSYQRRFWESAQSRFKVSGIYRIKMYCYEEN